jgi:hypothetical protein
LKVARGFFDPAAYNSTGATNASNKQNDKRYPIMKPVFPKLTLTRCVLILAVATVTWLPQPLSAQEKGATRLVRMNQLKTVAEVEAVQPGDTVVMSCPKCKDSWITVVEKTGKASSPTAQHQITQHQCPGCQTTITAEGQGKSKTDKVTHVCKHCGSKDAFCCVIKKGSSPTAGMEAQKP